MGMPCEVNSILKAKPSQGYPETLDLDSEFQVIKEGYRIIPVDVPILLVDENWFAHSDIVINRLEWHGEKTYLYCSVDRVYEEPFLVKL
jgi:hypothetical protein